MTHVPYAPGGYGWQPVDPSRVRDRIPHKSSHRGFGVRFAMSLITLGIIGAVVGGVVQDVLPAVRCGGACRRPPITTSPLPGPSVYRAAAGWSLEYGPADQLSVQSQSGSSIEFAVGNYPVAFQDEPAGGSTAEQIARRHADQVVPQGDFVYAIPNAELGFVRGYGAVYDAYLQTTGGQSRHVRYIVITAVRNGLAISMQAIGPYQPSTQSSGHPNPAGTPIAQLLSGPGNTVTWPR